jgi:hypothetical protein
MKYILPVMAALAATALMGLVLYPIVSIVIDRFFHLYLFTKPPADRWKDDLIIWITIALWFFIASGIGGFVCSYLTPKKEGLPILLFIIAAFLIAVLLSEGEIISDFAIEILILFISFIGGACTGNYICIKKKKKKLTNNPPSLPVQP